MNFYHMCHMSICYVDLQVTIFTCSVLMHSQQARRHCALNYNSNMIFKANRLFYLPDANASSPRRSRELLSSLKASIEKAYRTKKIMLLLLSSLIH